MIRWILARIGVPENEAADEAAKEAALRGPIGGHDVKLRFFWTRRKDTYLIRLAEAVKRTVHQRIKEWWAKQWEQERGAKPIRRLIKVPGKRL